MFSSLRGFVDRHKKKLVATSLVVGAAALAWRHARRALLEWEANETKKFLDLHRKRAHFESTEKTCDRTILSLAPAVGEAVLAALDTRELLAQLRSSPDDKAKLWERLKARTFARAAALIYAHAIAAVALRVQLNLVAGHAYRDSSSNSSSDAALNEEYLSVCRRFVAEGVAALARHVEAKVGRVVGPIPLKRKFTLPDAERLFWSIQAALCADDSDPLRRMASYFVGDDTGDARSPAFKTIVDETIDLMESDEVVALCISAVSRGFSLLFDLIAEGMNCPSTSDGRSATFVDVNQIELPLIKLIPIVNGLTARPFDPDASSDVDGGLCQPLLRQLVMNDKIKTLGANVYEVFSS